MKQPTLPFEAQDGTIRFEEISPEGADKALAETLEKDRNAFEELEKVADSVGYDLVRRLYDLSLAPLRTWGLVTHLHSVMNSQAWRELVAKHQPALIAFSLRIGQSQSILTALRKVKPSDPLQARILSKMLLEAKLAGVDLPEEARERFNALSAACGELGMQFTNNLLDATKTFRLPLDAEQVKPLPPSLQELLKQDDGSYAVTLESAVYVPFMKHSPDRNLRQRLHQAYATRAAEANKPIIDKLLRARHELANLLGYPDWISVSLATKMAQSEHSVVALLNQLSAVGLPLAKQELATLKEYAASKGWREEDLAPWDIPYWTERLRQEQYALDEEALRAWFPFEKVLQGLFNLSHSLFGITVHEATESVSRWHPDVRFYRIADRSGQPLASFYLDPYSRPETKSGGAWMNDFKSRDDLRGDLPVAVLVCNFPRPTQGKPSCLRFDDVTTLFHEFGHALQHMLTRVGVPQVAGINGIEWDAVEVASQFMENFCYAPAVLAALSFHFETGEALPAELIQRIIAARDFRAASAQQRQIYFALTDLALHGAEIPADPNAVKESIARQVLPSPPPEYDRFLCGFSHIFGGEYSAGYYSYKWSEVLAADLFEPFESVLDQPEALSRLGARYASTLFGEGGSRHPSEVFRELMGRDPSPEALLKHLRH